MNSAAVSEYIVFEEKMGKRDKEITFLNQQENFFGLTLKARNEILNHRHLNATAVSKAVKPQSAYKIVARRHRDLFFKNCTLRLGSIAAYQRAELVGRTDHAEGNFILMGENESRCISSVVSIGRHVLAYCMTIDKRVAFSDCDSGFQIADVPRFTDAVTRALNMHFEPLGNKVTRVLSGLCQYRHSRVIVGPLTKFARQPPNRIDAATVDVTDDAKYFLKPAENAGEKEFRIIWVMENDVEEDGVLIDCLDAAGFCRDIKRRSM
jgi:hypothetical protein